VERVEREVVVHLGEHAHDELVLVDWVEVESLASPDTAWLVCGVVERPRTRLRGIASDGATVAVDLLSLSGVG
jgi:hypothetical protein